MARLTEEMVIARSRQSDLAAVKKLNCWGAELSDVSLLQRMPNVEVLALSLNKIRTLRDFASLPRLRELYVRKNEVGALSELRHLRRLPHLTALWLEENPCAARADYRHTVLRNLPHLTRLDDRPVLPDERDEALRRGVLYRLSDDEEDDDDHDEGGGDGGGRPERHYDQERQRRQSGEWPPGAGDDNESETAPAPAPPPAPAAASTPYSQPQPPQQNNTDNSSSNQISEMKCIRHDTPPNSKQQEGLVLETATSPPKESNYETRDEDQEDSFGRNIAFQLRELERKQKIIAQKLISDVLYHAKLENLTEESVVSLQQQFYSATE